VIDEVTRKFARVMDEEQKQIDGQSAAGRGYGHYKG
jgi:hypothetical protein